MILTVTLNSAIDKVLLVDEFTPGLPMQAHKVVTSVGGKGLDAAVTLRHLGVETVGLAFVAGENGRQLAGLLESYGILPELIVAVGSQDIGFEKPDPRIFNYALKETGMQAQDCAYVGDEYMTDARAAKAVGMLGIFLDRNSNRDGQRQVTDVPSVRRLSELLSPDSPLWSGQ